MKPDWLVVGISGINPPPTEVKCIDNLPEGPKKLGVTWLYEQLCFFYHYDALQPFLFNPLTPTVATWTQLQNILCETGLSPSFVIFDIRVLWRSAMRCPYGNSGRQRVKHFAYVSVVSN